MGEKTRKFNAKRIAVAALLALALVAGGVAAGWFITSRGAAGSAGGEVTDTQSVGGGRTPGRSRPTPNRYPRTSSWAAGR